MIYVLILSPFEILVHSVFYKENGYDFVYRIFGHYKHNFTYSLVSKTEIILDTFVAIFDFCVIFLLFINNTSDHQVSFLGG